MPARLSNAAGDLYLADDLLQEAGDSLMMKLGEAANRLSRLGVEAPDGVDWALAVANKDAKAPHRYPKWVAALWRAHPEPAFPPVGSASRCAPQRRTPARITHRPPVTIGGSKRSEIRRLGRMVDLIDNRGRHGVQCRLDAASGWSAPVGCDHVGAGGERPIRSTTTGSRGPWG